MHENKSESIVEIFLSNWIFVLVVFFKLIIWLQEKTNKIYNKLKKRGDSFMRGSVVNA